MKHAQSRSARDTRRKELEREIADIDFELMSLDDQVDDLEGERDALQEQLDAIDEPEDEEPNPNDYGFRLVDEAMWIPPPTPYGAPLTGDQR